MGLTQDELISKIIRVLPPTNHRHANYKRTVALSELYSEVVTGIGQEHLIVSYKPRENEEQKQQRIDITNRRTKPVSNSVLSVFDKVNQVELKQDKIVFERNSDSSTATINAQISKFHANAPLKKYLNERFKFYNATDPNAWLVIGYDATTNESGQITDTPVSFPIEVSSASAFDYKFKNGILQYLVTCDRKKVNIDGEMVPINEYHGFTQGLQVFVAEWNPKAIGQDVYPENARGEILEPQHTQQIDDKLYYFWAWQTLSKETPAILWGYVLDYATRLTSVVSVIDAAMPTFIELINTGSEYDLSMALHTFLQKLMVQEPCDFTDEVDICDSGKLVHSGEECPKCKGSGIKVHKTSQDVLLVKRNQEGETYIPLSQMMHYVTMPFDVVTHQRDEIIRLIKQISFDIFGVDVSENMRENVTASAVNNMADSINAVLANYADHKSAVYKFTVRLMAQHAGIEEGMIVHHKHPRNYDVLSIAELLTVLKSAKDAGASFEVIQNIQNDVLSKQAMDNPAMLKLHDAKERHRPFKHLTEQERIIELAALPLDNKIRLLYIYNDIIFEALLHRVPAFLTMSRQGQDIEINKEIDLLIERLALQQEAVVSMRAEIEGEQAGGTTDAE